jgi:hypothetical protein
MDLAEQIIDTWQSNNRIHLYLLDAIPPEALSGVSLSKGRSVAQQFAHIHNVRLRWLKEAAPELIPNVSAIRLCVFPLPRSAITRYRKSVEYPLIPRRSFLSIIAHASCSPLQAHWLK